MRPKIDPGAASIRHRLDRELASIEQRSLHRRPLVLEGPHFCSNDYLGLARDPALAADVARAILAGGQVGSTGSRLLSGHVEAWERLEAEFASWIGVEDSLFFNSGYAANLGLLTSLIRPGDVVFSDSANHASLIDGIRLSECRKVIFPHLDLGYLEDALRREAGDGDRFIVVESIFSMDGDRAPLNELYELAERYGAGLIVDEAHATGVSGPGGRGATAAAGRPDALVASVHTCGKALASAGAFVACSSRLRDFLVNRARTFIYSTALPPYIAAQVSAAIGRVAAADDRRATLAGLSALLRDRLRGAGFDTGSGDTQIVPVLLGASERALAVAAGLEREGFPVRAIRPPTVPEGAARLRLSVTSDVARETLEALTDALAGLGAVV